MSPMPSFIVAIHSRYDRHAFAELEFGLIELPDAGFACPGLIGSLVTAPNMSLTGISAVFGGNTKQIQRVGTAP